MRVKNFFEEGRVANRKCWQVCREEFVKCGTHVDEVIANANNPLEIRKLFDKNPDARFDQNRDT